MANTLQQPEVEPYNRPNGHGPHAGVPDSNGFVSEDARRLADKHRTERERQMQALNLQRENILSQRTSHPARRSALEAALAQIEAQIHSMS